MANESFKNKGTIPDKPPKSTSHIVRPVKYIGNISLFLAFLGAFAGFLGTFGSLSRIFHLGISMPGVLPVSIVGLLFSFLSFFMAGKQAQIEKTTASNIAVVVGSIGLLLSVLGFSVALAVPSASQDIPEPNPDPNPGPIGDGYCSSTPECNDFGSRHCNGDGAVCGNDNLCHCIFAFCTGDNCRPMSCSEGCDANSKCDAQSGMCIFKNGGLTSD